MPRRITDLRLAACAGLVVLLSLAPRVGAVADKLPASISDREFWELSEQFSEPDGSFISDNLVSNEAALSTVAAELTQRTGTGGVYLGVGPEQNFTYIAAMKPKIAFITDIRRGNLCMHLMYKALFELSGNRADFVSRLLTKPRPAGLTPQSTATDLMNAYWDLKTSDEPVYRKNLDDIFNVLVKKHGWMLSQADRDGIEYVYHAFYWYGPRITYTSSTAGVNATGVTWADLMMSRDVASGQERSYLASEETYAVVKSLETRNLLVPVVGDFAGPKALRAVGQYVRDHDAKIGAFYVSNVEQYLRRNGVWPAFCANVATMPLDDVSTFIRPNGFGVTMVVQTGTTTGAGAAGGVINGTTGPPRGGMPTTPASSSFSGIATEVSNCASK